MHKPTVLEIITRLGRERQYSYQ